jgi:4-carboxymuconolactone decarboxylase
MSQEPENRIPPLPRAEWTDAAREVFAFWGEPNAWEEGSKTSIIMIMANNTDLAKAYNIWGKHMLVTNTVPIRPREIIVLRVAWKLKNLYEWHNHVGYGMQAGLTLEEIAAIGTGPDAGNWNEEDRAVLKAVDEQMQDNRVSDATWATLGKYFNRQQLMDLVFTIGQYVMTSWAIESFGVRLEPHIDKIGFDLKTESGATPGATLKPTEKWGG